MSFSSAKYPNILAHFRAAIGKGWPKVLTINRAGDYAPARRYPGALLASNTDSCSADSRSADAGDAHARGDGLDRGPGAA